MKNMKNMRPLLNAMIKVTRSNGNGFPTSRLNEIGKIVGIYESNNYFCIEMTKGKTKLNVYYGNHAYPDGWEFIDRQEQIKAVKEALEGINSEKAELEKEILFLERYETEEDFVADKLNTILKARGDTKKIASILKELRTSNYL